MEDIRKKAQSNPLLTATIVVSVAVILLGIAPSTRTESAVDEPAQQLEQTLRVKGTGTVAPEGVGDRLQGSGNVPQSDGASSESLQNSGGGLQPAGSVNRNDL